MDAEVSRLKFESATGALDSQAREFVQEMGWEVISRSYPSLRIVFTHPKSSRKVGFSFECDNWDEMPPSLWLFDPTSLQPLAWEKWPQGGWHAGNSHPVTGKPFLCLAGIREYHNHPSHVGDVWENYKSKASYSLLYLIQRVQQRFGDTGG